MRRAGAVLIVLGLAAAGQAAPSLQPVTLACPEDGIRTPLHLVSLQLLAPPPLVIVVDAPTEEALLDPREWIRTDRSPPPGAPMAPPLLNPADESPRQLFDPGQIAGSAGGNDDATRSSGAELGGNWGWLAGTVFRLEETSRGTDDEDQEHPWDDLLEERDSLDQDDMRLDNALTPPSAADKARENGRWKGLDPERRDIWRTLGSPESTRVESDRGFSGLSGSEDER